MLEHPVAGVRRWTIRLLGDDHRMNSAIEARLVGLATTEPDRAVRSQLASSCQRFGPHDALPILDRLAHRDEDAADAHLPNLIWWAFERQLQTDRSAVVSLLCTADARKVAVVTDRRRAHGPRACFRGRTGGLRAPRAATGRGARRRDGPPDRRRSRSWPRGPPAREGPPCPARFTRTTLEVWRRTRRRD